MGGGEYKKSPYALKINYDYNIYQNHYKGTGELIQATENELFILDDGKILTLKKDEQGLKVSVLKTTKTKNKIFENTIEINNLRESEINKLLQNKFIAAGTIYTNFGTALKENPLEIKKKFQFENKYNINIVTHVQDTLSADKEKKIQEIELKLKNEENQLINDNKNYYLDLALLQQEKNKLKENLSNYELNETKKNIIAIEKKVENYKPKTNLMIAEYKKQLEKIKNGNIGYFIYSGKINYIEVIK